MPPEDRPRVQNTYNKLVNTATSVPISNGNSDSESDPDSDPDPDSDSDSGFDFGLAGLLQKYERAEELQWFQFRLVGFDRFVFNSNLVDL